MIFDILWFEVCCSQRWPNGYDGDGTKIGTSQERRRVSKEIWLGKYSSLNLKYDEIWWNMMNICSLFQKLWVFADDLMCVLQIGASVARVDQLEAFTELFYFAEIIFGRLHPLLYSSHHSGTTAVVWALWEITMDIHGLVGCRWFLAAFGEGYLDDLRQTTEEIKGFFKEADMDGSGLNQSCCASPPGF